MRPKFLHVNFRRKTQILNPIGFNKDNTYSAYTSTKGKPDIYVSISYLESILDSDTIDKINQARVQEES